MAEAGPGKGADTDRVSAMSLAPCWELACSGEMGTIQSSKQAACPVLQSAGQGGGGAQR